MVCRRLLYFISVSSAFVGVSATVLVLGLLHLIDLHPLVGFFWLLTSLGLWLTAKIMIEKEVGKSVG